LHVTVATVVVEGGFADMSRATRRIFGPLEGKRASVADLYTAAAALERAYINAGYLLARVAVPRQSIVDGGQFHVVVIDGFIEQIDDAAVPRRVRGPIHAILAGLVGRHRLKSDLLQAKLARAGAVFGAHLRSTLARGDTPRRRAVDPGRPLLGIRWQHQRRQHLGPAFNHWGLSLTAQLNSPTGHGEQAYVFLSGGTRVDTDFTANAPRRIIGGG